jgi:hypothetical protein
MLRTHDAITLQVYVQENFASYSEAFDGSEYHWHTVAS